MTSRSKTLIDIIDTTHENQILDHIVFPNSIRDHDLTEIIRKMNWKMNNKNTKTVANYDVNKFKAGLRKIPWDTIIDENYLQCLDLVQTNSETS